MILDSYCRNEGRFDPVNDRNELQHSKELDPNRVLRKYKSNEKQNDDRLQKIINLNGQVID